MLGNDVNIQSIYQQYPCTHSIRHNKTHFKPGYIYLNNRRVLIHKTLQQTADNINKMSSFTNVKAKVLINTKGVERLVLISSRSIINITDPNSIFINLFQQKKIGTGEDKIIQGVGTRTKNYVKINYSSTKAVLIEGLKLSPELKFSSKLSSSAIAALANLPQEKVAPLLNRTRPRSLPILDVPPVNHFALSTAEKQCLRDFTNNIIRIESRLHNRTTWKTSKGQGDNPYNLTTYATKQEKLNAIKTFVANCRDSSSITELLIAAMTKRGKEIWLDNETSTFKKIVKELNSTDTNNITKQLFKRTLKIPENRVNQNFTAGDFNVIQEWLDYENRLQDLV